MKNELELILEEYAQDLRNNHNHVLNSIYSDLNDLVAWAEIGCPECGSGHSPEIDVGTGKGSVDTAIHNDDGSITCTICQGRIHSHFQENEKGEIEGTILRESEVEIEDCASCSRAFDRMRSEGFI